MTEDKTGLVSEEDAIRANTYALLANLLARAPDAGTLSLLRRIAVPDTGEGWQMGSAWNALKFVATQADPIALSDEYFALFIGIGKGELMPYASWYLTGFLMERPLALLRRDLARLGLQVQDGVHEPEDHAAALCETMSLIINSGEEIPFSVQHAFFRQHLAPWMERFFNDLQTAESARFYRAVGQVGEYFMTIEQQYLAMRI